MPTSSSFLIDIAVQNALVNAPEIHPASQDVIWVDVHVFYLCRTPAINTSSLMLAAPRKIKKILKLRTLSTLGRGHHKAKSTAMSFSHMGSSAIPATEQTPW